MPHDLVKMRVLTAGNVFFQTVETVQIQNWDEGSSSFKVVFREKEGVQRIDSVVFSKLHLPELYIKQEGAHSIVKLANEGSAKVLFEERFTEILAICAVE